MNHPGPGDLNQEKVRQIGAEPASISTILIQALDKALFGFDIVDENGLFVYVNPAYLRMWGYDSAEEILGTSPVQHCVDPTIPPQIIDTLHEKGMAEIEFKARRKDGSIFDVLMYSHVHKDETGREYYYGTSLDVSDRRKYLESLQKALREKDVLLRELFHRTNNTMQLVSSMLNLKAASMMHIPEVARLVKDSEQRISAIALVHEKLYEAEDLSHIEMADYIRELTENVSMRYSRVSVTIDYELEELSLLIDTALPCGLVLSELLNNAFIHAFGREDSGKIRISLRRLEDDRIMLHISDSGIGIKKDFAVERLGSMGLPMVVALVESQMKGSIRFYNNSGFCIEILFPASVYSERVPRRN